MKQLALISLALKRTQNNKGATKKLPSSSMNRSGSGIKTAADTNARGAEAAAARVVETPKTVGTPKPVERGGANNGRGTTFSSEESLSKVDFWKDSVTSSAVVEKITVGSPETPGSENSKLGSFFNGRKRDATTSKNSPENTLKSDSEALLEAQDAHSYVEQPDYDSDSWLR